VAEQGDVVYLDPEHAEVFGPRYYAEQFGIPYERSDHWVTFFGNIATRIANDLRPASVLDVGCAFGFLVEELRALEVDAWGIEVSTYALEQVAPEVEPFCRLASITDPLPRQYSLITCIEVLEHLPPEVTELAVRNMCESADLILVSTTPGHFDDPTHVNVRPLDEWASMFARHGFVHDLDFDATFVSPWAMLFRRASTGLPAVVRAYERDLWRLRSEIAELRPALSRLYQRFQEVPVPEEAAPRTAAEEVAPPEPGPDVEPLLARIAELEALVERLASEATELERAREAAHVAHRDAEVRTLEARDAAIGAEASLGHALGQLQLATMELETTRRDLAAHQLALNTILGSRTWRVFEPYRRIMKRMRRRG
jgi:SAM-dependent methyltransferase